MRQTLKPWLFAMGLLLPAGHALAADWFAWQSNDTLRWRSEGQYLHLTTEQGGGVKVVKDDPADLWGLHANDVILEADGKAVSSVAGFMIALRAHANTPLPLKVRRNGVEQPEILAAKARAGLLHEEPPMPASPPPVPGV